MEGPSISDYYTGGGNTLKPSDVDGELTATIVGWREAKWDDGSKTLYLKLEGYDQEFRCNITNMERISEMYGPQIARWVGKEITLFPDIIASGKYKGKDTILVKIRRANRNAAKKQAFDERNPPPSDDIPF